MRKPGSRLALLLLAAGITACSAQQAPQIAGTAAPSPPDTPATALATVPVTAPDTTAAASSPSPADCAASLWQHVYHPYRLQVISWCRSVTGTVQGVRREPDGDLHILLAVRPSLVNAANQLDEHGDLVLEVICQGHISQADARQPCQGLRQHLTIPSAGDRIRVKGSYVLDADHGWMEIHPVASLVVISTPPQAAPPAQTARAVPATSYAPPPSRVPSPPPPASGCYPKTPSGNCYEPGEFCSAAEHGETGVAGDRKTITCENTDPGSTWHWVVT